VTQGPVIDRLPLAQRHLVHVHVKRRHRGVLRGRGIAQPIHAVPHRERPCRDECHAGRWGGDGTRGDRHTRCQPARHHRIPHRREPLVGREELRAIRRAVVEPDPQPHVRIREDSREAKKGSNVENRITH